MKPLDAGDGDRCPEDPAHGQMYVFKGNVRTYQWCPSARHQGSPWYDHDGAPTTRTADPASRPAVESSSRRQTKTPR